MAEAVANTWNGVARRGAGDADSNTRVSFFPTAGKSVDGKLLQAVPVLRSPDLQAVLSPTEGGRKAVTVALPPKRPVASEVPQLEAPPVQRRIPASVRTSQPLDLLRFVKVSTQP